MNPSDEYENWRLELRTAWAALTPLEQGCLIRERMRWRGWPQSRYDEMPKPARDGPAYKEAHAELWNVEKNYRVSSYCRGAVEDR